MRVFVAGASGAIGIRLVPQLIDAKHEVIGTHHSPSNAERLRALGAKPAALDLLDPAAVRRAVLEAEPDAIVHQATALADIRFVRNFDRPFAQTNRLRTEGTDNLLAAAREAGVPRFVAQSFASLRNAREGGMVKTEDDPLDPTPVPSTRQSNAAMRHLEQTVTEAGGIALRYGGFYGATNDALPRPSASSAGRCATRAGGKASRRHTRNRPDRRVRYNARAGEPVTPIPSVSLRPSGASTAPPRSAGAERPPVTARASPRIGEYGPPRRDAYRRIWRVERRSGVRRYVRVSSEYRILQSRQSPRIGLLWSAESGEPNACWLGRDGSRNAEDSAGIESPRS
jgi:nucleoside-diphosphate-sugar epimerase